MNKRPQIIKQCMTAFGIAINIAGAFIAMNLHLPIYMDSIGTVMNAALLGNRAGLLQQDFWEVF